MTYVFRSKETDPYRRGVEFGTHHSEKVRATVRQYARMFEEFANAPVDLEEYGGSALESIKDYAPELASEIEGIAKGAGLSPHEVAAINARTEILACIGAQTRGECSAVVLLPPGGAVPLAMQTWDWYYALADSWLVWEIPHADGSETRVMTEYGIVGKSGINSHGVGLLFTILHHSDDGAGMGMPVHVAARAALDRGVDINVAAQNLAQAKVSASSSINLVSYEAGVSAALSVELHPGGPSFVSPDETGLLVHTNHFLSPEPSKHDTEPHVFPDTIIRRDLLIRRCKQTDVTSIPDLVSVMSSHLGSTAAVCCHHDVAKSATPQYETLATVMLNFTDKSLHVHAGGPCSIS